MKTNITNDQTAEIMMNTHKATMLLKDLIETYQEPSEDDMQSLRAAICHEMDNHKHETLPWSYKMAWDIPEIITKIDIIYDYVLANQKILIEI